MQVPNGTSEEWVCPVSMLDSSQIFHSNISRYKFNIVRLYNFGFVKSLIDLGYQVLVPRYTYIYLNDFLMQIEESTLVQPSKLLLNDAA